MKSDESKVDSVYGNLQICFFVGKVVAAKYFREGEGLAEEGWVINSTVGSAICTEFSDAFFFFCQAPVKSS